MSLAKLALLLAAMRDHAGALERAGFEVSYHCVEEGRATTQTLAATSIR